MNPFDDPENTFEVLQNDEGQYSLWLVGLDVPAGWKAVYGPSSREDCTRFVEEVWVDQRPTTLATGGPQTREQKIGSEPGEL